MSFSKIAHNGIAVQFSQKYAIMKAYKNEVVNA